MFKKTKYEEGTLFTIKDVENLNLPYDDILNLPLDTEGKFVV